MIFDSTPPLDIDNLRSLFRQALNEALQLFLGVARGVAADLPGVLATRDSQVVWAAGHKLVGSSRMAGAKGLVAACEALCAAAESEDWPAADAASRRILEEIERIESWLVWWQSRQEDAVSC